MPIRGVSMRRIFLSIGGVVLMSSAASADFNPYICDLYTGDEPNRPAEVRQIAEIAIGAMVKACTATNSPSIYLLVLPAERKTSRVCHYTEQRVFRASGHDTIWTMTPPEGEDSKAVDLMFVSQGVCPTPEDWRYVRVVDATEEIFLNFSNFWNQVVSNQSDFDAVFGGVSSQRRESTFYSEFKATVKNVEGARNLRVVSFSRHRSLPSRYEAVIRAGANAWRLVIDASNEGLTVKDIYPF